MKLQTMIRGGWLFFCALILGASGLKAVTVLDTSDSFGAGSEVLYPLSISQSGTLDISVAGSTNMSGRLENVTHVLLASGGGSSPNFSISYSVSPGTYYVRVWGTSSSVAGNFTITAELTPSSGGGSGPNVLPRITQFSVRNAETGSPNNGTSTVSPGDHVRIILHAEDDNENMHAYTIRHVDRGGPINPGRLGAGTPPHYLDVDFSDYVIPSNGGAVFQAEVTDDDTIDGDLATTAVATDTVTVIGVGNAKPNVVFNSGPTALEVGQYGSWTYSASDSDGDLDTWSLTTRKGSTIIETEFEDLPNYQPYTNSPPPGHKTRKFDDPGVYTFILEATDSHHESRSTEWNVEVSPSPIPSITNSGSAAGIQSEPFGFYITATNNPTSFSISAITPLPLGLSLDASTGLISGTPTLLGSYPIIVNASNGNGTGSANLTILVVSGTLSADVETPPVIARPSMGTLNHTITLKGYSSASLLLQYKYRVFRPDTTEINLGDTNTWINFNGAPVMFGNIPKTVPLAFDSPLGDYHVEISVKTAGQERTVTRAFTLAASVPPQALPASNISATGFRANWVAPVGGAAAYELDVSTIDTFATTIFSGNVGNVLFKDVSASPSTHYYYRVRAVTDTGTKSGNSNVIQLFTRPNVNVAAIGWGTITPSTNPGLPTPAVSGVGTLDGELTVDNHGAANYVLPLKLPPGRGGQQPSLSLNYSSNGGNGPLGLGWSVSTGLPQMITRGRSILARDGVVRGVTFDNNDKFYLDGKRLLLISGTYGEPGSTYRTEVDSFVTITTTGSGMGAGANIDTFTLTDKQGRRFTFGKLGTDNDGYQMGAATGETRAYAYALKHVEDTLGYTIDLRYQEVVNTTGQHFGEYVLSEIQYTGTTTPASSGNALVTFHYNITSLAGTTDRLDANFSYQGGRLFGRSRRLDGINVTYDGGRVAYYKLGYEYAPHSGPLRLTSVTPYFHDATGSGYMTLAPTSFTWSNTTPQFTSVSVNPNPLDTQAEIFDPDMPEHYAFGDIDGDGKDDCVWFGSTISVQLSNGTGLGNPAYWYNGGGGFNPRIWKLADVNGDGKKDIIAGLVNIGTGHLQLWCLVSTGSSFVPLLGADVNGTPFEIYSSDQDFTGLDANNNLGTESAYGEFRSRETGALTQRITVADFTGDGRDDILIHRYDGQLKLIKNGGTSFTAQTYNVGAQGLHSTALYTGWVGSSLQMLGYNFVSVAVSMIPCDLNGDGITDYAWSETTANIDQDGTQSPPELRGANTTQAFYAVTSLPGGGFSQKTSIMADGWNLSKFAPNGGWFYRDSSFVVMPGDVNGDGLTDFTVLFKDYADVVPGDTNYMQFYLQHVVYLSKGAAGVPEFQGVLSFPNRTPSTWTVPVAGAQVLPWFDKMPFSRFKTDFTMPWIEFAFTSRQQVIHALGTTAGEGVALCDVNLDGRDDYVWYVVGGSQPGWWVMYSLGATYSTPEPAPLGWLAPRQLDQDGLSYLSVYRSSRMALDLNGDGVKDYAYAEHLMRSGPGIAGFHVSTSLRGDRLTLISNGLGRTTEVAYKPITDGSVYTPGAVDTFGTPAVEGVTYPIRELRNSTYVVSDLWRDAGASAANRSHFTYQYSGNRLDLSGRGPLGFHAFVTLDAQTKVLKYQFLAQSFPMTGLTHREETYRYLAANSFNILSSHDNTVVFDKVGVDGPTLWPFISQATESRWEDGAGHLTPTGTGTTSSPDSNPEKLFSLPKPTGAHINITATSWFDEQALNNPPPSSLPGGFSPSDNVTTTTNTNVVIGKPDDMDSTAAFSALPGKITYGNLTKLETDFGGGYGERGLMHYQGPTSNGLTGLVQDTQTFAWGGGFGTAAAPEAAPKKSYTYWTNGSTPTPLVETETVDASVATNGEARLSTTTTYTRGTRGRLEKTTLTGTGLLTLLQPQTSIDTYQATTFDDRFDLPTEEKNAYGHTTTKVYHSFLGLPTSVKDVNNAEVTTTYDALGRVVQMQDVLKGLTTTTAFALDSSVSVTPPDATPNVPFNGVAPGSSIIGTSGLTISSAYKVTTSKTAQPTITAYYDRLGRVLRTVKDGFNNQQIKTDTAYNTLGQAVSISLPYTTGTTYWTKTSYDELGRAKVVEAPNGTKTTMDYTGRLATVTVDAPDLGGTNPPAQINTTLADPKGRNVKVWNPQNPADATGSNTPSVAFDLDGFGRMRRTTLKGQTQQITAQYDALGRQTQLVDPDKGTWNYVNSALGQMLKQTDALGNKVETQYDALGRTLIRTTTEASNGSAEETKWFYYDTATNAADATKQVVAGAEKSWIGALNHVESAPVTGTAAPPGYAAANSTTQMIYGYNAKGLLEVEVTVRDGKWFQALTNYDLQSRVDTIRLSWRPAGQEAPNQSAFTWQDFGYKYYYDTKSYVVKIDDLVPTDNYLTGGLPPASRTWWETDATQGYDHMDRPVRVRKGSGHWTTRTYRATDGVLTAIATGPAQGSTAIQNLTFNYDGLGNLTQRIGTAGAAENLTYDELNRLTGSAQGTITYFDNGNIKQKPNVSGTPPPNDFGYYDSTRPHALQTAFGYTMGYDANGNVNSRTGNGETWDFRYTAFDKPRWMAKTTAAGTVGSEFLYDANRSRTVHLEFKALSGNEPSQYVRKRVYAFGGMLEANYENHPAISGAPEWRPQKIRIYIPGPDGTVGVREFDPVYPSSTGAEKAFVYHYDHLGSIDSVTLFGDTTATFAKDSAIPAKISRFSESAWGERRNPFTWSGPPAATGTNASDDGGADSVTPRGFTSHEMLDDLGLVHMNGRIYDPLLGRMLSADLSVKNPASLQDYNRYSYVGNNPLSRIDPSGFLETTITEEQAKKLKDVSEELNKRVNNAVRSVLDSVKNGKMKAEDAPRAIYKELVGLAGEVKGGNDIKISVDIKGLGSVYYQKAEYKGSRYEGGIIVPDKGKEAVRNEARKFIDANIKGAEVMPDGIKNALLDRAVNQQVEHNKYGDTVWKEGVIAGGVNIGGNAIGTDKIDHMFYDGFNVAGLTEEKALEMSRERERGVAGLEMTGVFSNADVSANMNGRKFYRDVYQAAKTGVDYKFDIANFNVSDMDENKNPNQYSPAMQGVVDRNTKGGAGR